MIVKELELPNGAKATTFKLLSLTMNGSLQEATLTFAAYKDVASFVAGSAFIWAVPLSVPVTQIPGLTERQIEESLVVSGMFSGGGLVYLDGGTEFEVARSLKLAEITAARWAANNSYFMFQGKQIAIDMLSTKDVEWTTSVVAVTGALPANFPGAWKARDNSYVLIPDVATWREFLLAGYNQGAANFARSEQLKAYVKDPARTLQEILAVSWDSPLPQPSGAPASPPPPAPPAPPLPPPPLFTPES